MKRINSQAAEDWMKTHRRGRDDSHVHIFQAKNGERKGAANWVVPLINCMMVFEALHGWWKLINGDVLVPDICMASIPNRLNFSGRWILTELTQISKALLGTWEQYSHRGPSRLRQKHLGRCAPRPCDLWHDKQRAAKVWKDLAGTKSHSEIVWNPQILKVLYWT